MLAKFGVQDAGEFIEQGIVLRLEKTLIEVVNADVRFKRYALEVGGNGGSLADAFKPYRCSRQLAEPADQR